MRPRHERKNVTSVTGDVFGDVSLTCVVCVKWISQIKHLMHQNLITWFYLLYIEGKEIRGKASFLACFSTRVPAAGYSQCAGILPEER